MAYLWDVREAAKSILIFTQDLDAVGDSASDLIRAAVERKFEVVGVPQSACEAGLS